MNLLQKVLKRRTILSLFISLVMILLVSVPSGHALAGPSVTIIRPWADTYFVIGSTMYIKAQVSGNPTSVTAQYLCRYSYNNNSYVQIDLGNLTKVGNYWEKYYTITSTLYFPRLASVAPNLSVITPKIQVTATDGTGTTKVSVNATLCCDYQSTYSSVDTTFFYYNEYVNSFWGCFTGHPLYQSVPTNMTYNCMAYALGRLSGGWLWPWGGTPTYVQVCSVLQGAPYYYTQCSSTPFSGAQVIYYAGGHFSKVTTWDVNGLPSMIRSKWGGMELLVSQNANPFTSYPYGSAIGYFKK